MQAGLPCLGAPVSLYATPCSSASKAETPRSMDPTTVASAGLPQWLDDELRCVICTDIFINPYAVNGCGHVFCHECVSHWLTTQSSQCPICRHRLSLPISLALTPCVMAQGLLDHYVLPYLPPEDVEARRERAREVRDKAAKRATAARRPPTSFPGSPGGGAMSGVAAATAALAHVFSRGSGISSIRVTGAANVNGAAVSRGTRAASDAYRCRCALESSAGAHRSRNGRSRGWVGPGRFYGGYGKHPEVYKRLAPPPSGQWAAPRGTARGHSAASERS